MSLATTNITSTMDTVRSQITPQESSTAGQNEENRECEKSWYDIMVEEEEEELQAAQRKHQEVGEVSSQHSEAGSKNTPEDELVMSSWHKAANERQIEIDILDSANVKKYEKLVKSDLIKSPFKRRLSGNSSSDEVDEGSPTEMNCERDDGTEPSSLWKRSKKDETDYGRQRFRRESSSSGASSQTSRKHVEYETDEAVLARRQKQIDYGKNTLGYENYIKQVPRDERRLDQPKTPQKHLKYSRRAWDGIIKIWRKQLHCYDPNSKMEDDK